MKLDVLIKPDFAYSSIWNYHPLLLGDRHIIISGTDDDDLTPLITASDEGNSEIGTECPGIDDVLGASVSA